jgi:hypothetical protein
LPLRQNCVTKKLSAKNAKSDLPIIGLAGGYHGEEVEEKGEEVTSAIPFIG